MFMGGVGGMIIRLIVVEHDHREAVDKPVGKIPRIPELLTLGIVILHKDWNKRAG